MSFFSLTERFAVLFGYRVNESLWSELNLVFLFVCGLASSKFVWKYKKTKLENVLGIGFQFFISDSYARGWVRSHQIHALLVLSLILLF